MKSLTQAVLFSLPFVLTGLLHMAIIKRNVLSTLSHWPLDFRLTIRNRRVFGSNKTFRGLFVIVAGQALFVEIEYLILRQTSLSDALLINVNTLNPALWGATLGLGWVLGELPNSFIKRQVGVPPGQPARGLFFPLFWALDQVDSLIGILSLGALLGSLPYPVVIWLIILVLILHPLGGALLHQQPPSRNEARTT